MNDKPSKQRKPKQARRAYRKPTLVKYGDLGRVTQSEFVATGGLDGEIVSGFLLKTG